jgi:TRAP-type mannitol/chloroaromatic compound transport system substrate-binding protein
MKISRKTLVSAAVSVAFACGTLASGTALAVDKIRWAVPMAFGSNLTALGDTMPWVAQLLDKMSGGAIKFSVQEPGKLIPALAVFDNVSAGKVEAGYTWMVHRLVLLRRRRQDGQGTLCAA